MWGKLWTFYLGYLVKLYWKSSSGKFIPLGPPLPTFEGHEAEPKIQKKLTSV